LVKKSVLLVYPSFFVNSGRCKSLSNTTSRELSFPAKVETFLLFEIVFVWQFLGRHDLFIKEHVEPESSSILKRRVLLTVPIVLAVKMVTGVLFFWAKTFGPRK
jgi:hypothetical protein